MRFLPLAVLAGFFLAAMAGRSALQRVRFGNWGIALFRKGSMLDLLFLALPGLLFAQAALQAAGRASLPPLWPPSAAGVLPALAGLALILRAQLEMGSSWRIGIDPAPTALIVTGLDARSRNPIYLGLLVGLSGFTLLLPNLPSLAVLCAAAAAIRAQVAREESHLEAQLGPAFRAYAARVPRFI